MITNKKGILYLRTYFVGVYVVRIHVRKKNEHEYSLFQQKTRISEHDTNRWIQYYVYPSTLSLTSLATYCRELQTRWLQHQAGVLERYARLCCMLSGWQRHERARNQMWRLSKRSSRSLECSMGLLGKVCVPYRPADGFLKGNEPNGAPRFCTRVVRRSTNALALTS